MNKVINQCTAEYVTSAGNLYRTKGGCMFFILGVLVLNDELRYVAIGLLDGHRWTNPTLSMEGAVEGLIPLPKNVTITISKED